MTIDIMVAIDEANYEELASGGAYHRHWTKEEEQFLAEHIGRMTDAEIGEKIDRTENAVKVHRVREMGIKGPSKAAGLVTAHQASKLLGLLERRKPAYWVDRGLLRGWLMPARRKIRLIDRSDLERFVVNPMNWIYFDIDQVRDARLLRLISLRKERWGDEWWTTPQVAAHHGVHTKDVTRVIKHGKLPAVQTELSLGARSENRRWSYWFVLRSDAIAFNFITRSNPKRRFSTAAEAWILKARDELGWNFPRISRGMKVHSAELVRLHYYRMKGGLI